MNVVGVQESWAGPQVGLIRAVCTLLVCWARTAGSAAAVVSDLQIENKEYRVYSFWYGETGMGE
jgi:hypothetical protein